MSSTIKLPPRPLTDKPAPQPRRTRIKRLRIALIIAGFTVLAGVSMVFGMMMAVASELPKLEDREQYRVARPSELLDADGRHLAALRSNENRILVSSGAIDASMKQAVVAIEDRRFYDHKGVDFRGIGRALYTDIRQGGARQGASTITQQFVKNALAAQSDRSVFQKLREAALAYHLERQWSKDKILTQYLNTVYFGNGAYGIEAAARTYFGKTAHPGCERTGCARALLPWESALLAGIIASPSAYDPVAYPRRATARRAQILGMMLDQGYLTRRAYNEGMETVVPTGDDVRQPRIESKAPYFSLWARQQLVDRYQAGLVFSGGLRVRTTLDLDLQAAAEQSIRGRLPVGGPTASMVAIENKTGKVRALVGGLDYERRPFNLATQGHRQPGSAFKTFVLISALQKGYGLGSSWSSRKKTLRYRGDRFEVNNYEDSYAGALTLGNATISSDNSVFAEVGLKVGTRKIARLARKMGVRTAISTNAAMTLGGLRNGVTPLEMAFAYATLANGGRRPSGTLASYPGGPVAIEEVRRGGELFRDQRDRRDSERVFSGAVARAATSALQGVVRFGTGKAAAYGGFAAGKTGTTENYGDAWFVGFTDRLTIAVWVGYPDKLQYMTTEFGGKPVAGGTFPALIWRDFVLAANRILADDRSSKGGSTAPTTVAPVATTPTTQTTEPPEGEKKGRSKPRAEAPEPKPAPDAPAPGGGDDVPVTPGGGTAPGASP